MRLLFALGLGVMLLLPRVARAGESDAAARTTVEKLNAVCLEVMKSAQKLGYTGRYARLAPVLQKTFDFAAMARLSLGGRWKDLSAEQQAKFVETFGKLSVATYAGRFVGYTGERFDILGEETSAQSTVLVRTQVVIPEKPPVQLDYRLRVSPEGWRIIDVFFDGTVSELALRRSEYTSVLDRDGFDGLIAALNEKIEAFAAKPAPPSNS